MTTTPGTPPLAEWEKELLELAATPATPAPEPAGLAPVLAAVRQACAALPTEYQWWDGRTSPCDTTWERGMIRAAAEEAMSYPDPAALVPAILHATRPGKYAVLGEYWNRTASGCQHAARAEVQALAASLGQEQGFWNIQANARIEDAVRAGNGGTGEPQ